MKIHELLSDNRKWIRRKSAADKYGYSVEPTSPQAVCWCLSGAIEKCYLGTAENTHIRVVIIEYLQRKLNWTSPLWLYNDAVSYEKIKELVDELDI